MTACTTTSRCRPRPVPAPHATNKPSTHGEPNLRECPTRRSVPTVVEWLIGGPVTVPAVPTSTRAIVLWDYRQVASYPSHHAGSITYDHIPNSRSQQTMPQPQNLCPPGLRTPGHARASRCSKLAASRFGIESLALTSLSAGYRARQREMAPRERIGGIPVGSSVTQKAGAPRWHLVRRWRDQYSYPQHH